jgi:hypothetical protein
MCVQRECNSGIGDEILMGDRRPATTFAPLTMRPHICHQTRAEHGVGSTLKWKEGALR